ncbi:MAG TPA: winged helix-turn-helix domain-containing protein, partial [Solirubrobacterales bacterium]
MLLMMYDSQSGGAGGQEDRETNADGERVGSRALSVFTRVLNARILRAHVAGPLSSKQLEQELGWAPKASLRVATVGLCEVGALLRSEPHGARQGTVTELTPAGADLLALADVLERWLANSPFGPIPLPDTAARGAVRALAAGWDAAIVGAVAERPRTLAELSAEISGHSYPGLKRRLAKLRAANLVTLVPDGKRSPMHAATQWLRCAVGPLSVAGRWELQHARASARPMTRREIEAKFLLALPLVELPEDTSGSCVLAAL